MDLNLLQYKSALRIESIGSKTYVFDPIRKKFILLTPEELTRQLLVYYLINVKRYRPALIQLEKKVEVNGMTKRYDIIAFDKSFKPFLLVECKSHKVRIQAKTFEQISRYNLGLKSNYLLVSNGITNYCHEMDYQNGNIKLLKEIPSFA